MVYKYVIIEFEYYDLKLTKYIKGLCYLRFDLIEN